MAEEFDETSPLGMLAASMAGGADADPERMKAVTDQLGKQVDSARTAREKQGTVLQQAYDVYKSRSDATRNLIASQKPDNTAAWLKFAGGLMGPTKTGAFGESVSNALNQAAPEFAATDKAKREQAMALAGLDEKAAEFSYKTQQDQMKSLQELERDYNRSYTQALIQAARAGKLNRSQFIVSADGIRRINPDGSLTLIPGTAGAQPRESVRRVTGAEAEKLGLSPENVWQVDSSGKATLLEAGKPKTATPEEEKKWAADMGVPYVDPRVAPWAGQTDPAKIDITKGAIARERVKAQEAEQEENAGAVTKIRDAKTFLSTMEKVGTGGLENWGPIGAVRSMFDPDISLMRSISDKLTPGMRAPGSGATSDFDARMFKSATLDPTKPSEANRVIASAIIGMETNRMEYNKFKARYFDVHKHTQGAERAWDEYLTANPIFDPDSTEARPMLNTNRLTSEQFFRLDAKERAELARGMKERTGG